jgi:hypothetical protein
VFEPPEPLERERGDVGARAAVAADRQVGEEDVGAQVHAVAEAAADHQAGHERGGGGAARQAERAGEARLEHERVRGHAFGIGASGRRKGREHHERSEPFEHEEPPAPTVVVGNRRR